MPGKNRQPLSVTHPDLASEWHPTRNGDVRPSDIVAGSNKRFWWKCPKGDDHEWQASGNKRTAGRGTGCPFCSGRQVSVTNALATLFPEIAAEWHPTKNGSLTPANVVPGSEQKVWWKCPKGDDHEWLASIYVRTKSQGSSCPCCNGRKASVTNSLASLFPEIAAELHPTMNGDLRAAGIPARSTKKVWWKCRKEDGHEWKAASFDRIRGQSCPNCRPTRSLPIPSTPSLFPEMSIEPHVATTTGTPEAFFQKIIAEWHPTKNGELKPTDVVPGSTRKIWWKCPHGMDHEWQARLADRTGRDKTGCPFCRGSRLSVTNSLASRFPEIAAEWHPTKNRNLTAENIVAGSNTKVWWKCPKGDDHEWEAKVVARTRGTGCPFCSGNRVSATNSLATQFPEIAAEWHPTKNGELTPSDLIAGSTRKVWWKCQIADDHEWESPPSARTGSGKSGCPVCSNYKVSSTNSLASRFPEIAAEWHPTRNGDLFPTNVVPGSNKLVWWKCPKGKDHEWEAQPNARTGKRTDGCPFCSGNKVSVTNSLAALFPEIAVEWHPYNNADLTPTDVVAGSSKKVWWKCPMGEDHEWQTTIGSRTGSQKSGCPCCSGNKVSTTNSLAALFPEIAVEWHPRKNADSGPTDVVAGSQQKVWWKCPYGDDHEWEATPGSRTGKEKTGCPFCRGSRLSMTNSLASKFPEIAAEWHPTKNGGLQPEDIVAGSTEKVWWKCPKGDDHEWINTPGARTGHRKDGCPFCRGFRASATNSVAALFPEIASEWHLSRNGELRPADVVAGSSQKVWWKCSKGPDHEWEACPAARTGGQKTACPFCSGNRVSVTNSLETLFPEISSEWHPVLNGHLTPRDVVAGSTRKVWWKCPIGEDHEWEAKIVYRTWHGYGCPICNTGWTLGNVRRFVKSLLDQNLLRSLSAAELFLLAQQNGLGGTGKRRSEFVKALTSGRLSADVLEEFVNSDSGSQVEQLFGDISAEKFLTIVSDENASDESDVEISDAAINGEPEAKLPEVSAGKILDSLDSNLWSTADEEAVEFLVASGMSKLWKKAYSLTDLADLRDEINSPRNGEYSERVRSEFLAELDAAESISIPNGYDFRINGQSILPNLMQRHVAAQVRDRRRVGNWSGTGAGKTLSAVLASRVIDAELTVVLCPNSVIHNGWTDTIKNAFPDSRVATKTLSPHWASGHGPRYLILNYETLQQPAAESQLAAFLKLNRVDFVVIDEIHYTKQRTDEASKRRRLTVALCATAVESNPELAVLGLSATPVINNLREGVSMIGLVSGLDHSDLKTTATVDNCMKIHQRLVRLGARWMPPYPEFAKQNPRVDVTDVVDDIRALPKGSSGLLRLEQILLESKLACILENVEDGTLIYTEYVDEIVLTLTKALSQAGWKVGRFTGEDKTGLIPFLEGKLNVLIGSSSVGTGVDGLQHRANRLIIACAPWTAAAYEQLVGRLVRQGQQKPVEVIFPITFANVNGEEWSWCQSRLNRLQYKKSIADAAVDGVVPTGHLRSPEQAFQDALGWLQRLESGAVAEVKRSRIVVPLSDTPVDVERRIAKYGDFSVMNNRWNSTGSGKLHERLHQDPAEWENYHTLYRQSRASWVIVPFEKIGDWISQLPRNRVVADFGCGEDLLGRRLRAQGYLVHSFDHVPISDEVVRCDIGEGVPLPDGEIDVAVFSLSLMGVNSGDYLREAARTLVFDGRLIICEATSRLPEDSEIRRRLDRLGFHVTQINNDAQFTFIQALRTDNPPNYDMSLIGTESQ